MQKNLITNILDKIGGIFNHLVLIEKDPINKARIKMLAYILVSYLIFSGILTLVYTINNETLHLIRVSFVFVVIIFLIAITYFKHSWKAVSHVVLCFCTFAVWTNVTIYAQGINLETLQFIWLGCVLGFYMHGLKWGWFYSALNILPIMIYTALDNKNYFSIGIGPHQVSQLTYIFVTSYNFVLIIFLQYYFFRTFNRVFINLNKTKNELNTLNDKLKISLHDVENLSNARMDFLSTMSHELRTPLNGVIGISNALLLQNPRQDQEENLAVLKFSAENLLLLINDVLDFNKFDLDMVEMEKISFNLSELIKNNCASLKLKAQEKMLDLYLQMDQELEGKYVNSDPTRLTQILSNLLNNAIKFTEKGSVNLEVSIIQLNTDTMIVRFTIQDTGIGISPDKQGKIFAPYVQASTSTNRNYGGTGLGLSIVKKVLTMFNSKVELTSKPGMGTKMSFDIDFSYQNIDTTKAAETEITKDELAHIKILVAEDNQVNILVIKKTLEKWNIIPEIAENGVIALQKLEKDNFHLILMDLYMPEMDGYETAIAIRSLADYNKAKTPIIALTASVNDNIMIQKILQAGMNDYLTKPFNPEHLFKKIKDITIEIN